MALRRNPALSAYSSSYGAPTPYGSSPSSTYGTQLSSSAARRSASLGVSARSTVPAASPAPPVSYRSQTESFVPAAPTSSLSRGRQLNLPTVDAPSTQRRSSSTMYGGGGGSGSSGYGTRERDADEVEIRNPVQTRYQSQLASDRYSTSSVADSYSSSALPARGMPSIASLPAAASPQGFRNLGNTCYMNAALQCVLHSSGNLLRLLRNSEARGSSRGSITESLLQLGETADFKTLLAVKDFVSRMNAEFTGTRQNDSHEFIRELLYGIHKEVNRVRGKPKYVEMKDIPGEDDADAAARWMEYMKTHDDSVIYDLFGGFLRSVTKCDNCNYRSLVFDPILDLSVQVAPTLGQSLHMLNSMEDITILTCEKCKKKNATGRRQTVVVKWPQCLMIHLKRFSASGRKDADPVAYPMNITAGTISENAIVLPKGTRFPDRGYTLSGVVMHQGSMGFGHYTAMVRQGTKWYECDDSRITQVSDRTATTATSAGYILFYSQTD